MTRRALVILLGAAALLSLLAWAATRQRAASDGAQSRAREPFLPELGAGVEAVDAIEIRRGERRLELRREGDRWIAPEKAGLAVRPERVAELLRGLARLRIEQAMTASAERLGELGLAWPDDRGEATRVLLRAGDATVADLIVGRTRFSPPSVYVRRADETQAWRTLGEVPVEIDAARLMDPTLLALDEAAIAMIEAPRAVVGRAPAGSGAEDEADGDGSDGSDSTPRWTLAWREGSGPPEADAAERASDDAETDDADAGARDELARALVGLFTRLEFDDARGAAPASIDGDAEAIVAAVGDRTVALELLPADDGAADDRGGRWYRLVVGPPQPGLAHAALDPETNAALDETARLVEGREFRLPGWTVRRIERALR